MSALLPDGVSSVETTRTKFLEGQPYPGHAEARWSAELLSPEGCVNASFVFSDTTADLFGGGSSLQRALWLGLADRHAAVVARENAPLRQGNL